LLGVLENCVEPVLDHLTEKNFNKNASDWLIAVRGDSLAEVGSQQCIKKKEERASANVTNA
jgi:hypothetical protein